MQNSSNPTSNKQSGFSLLECLLALGIMAVLSVQVLSVMANSIAISQKSWDNMRATWAMRSAFSQLEYVMDAIGFENLPKSEINYEWTGEKGFRVRFLVDEASIEASSLLVTALKAGAAMGAAQDPNAKKEDEAESGISEQIKSIGPMLDSQVPKDMYKRVTVEVSWPDGEARRTMEGGVLLINEKAIAIMPSSDKSATSSASPVPGASPTAAGSPTQVPSPGAAP
jgi:prepilin-type N-terminal cleavage/methylation domain-containing protein